MKSNITSGLTTRREFLRTFTAGLTALGVKGATAAISKTASSSPSSHAKRPCCCKTPAKEEQGLGRDRSAATRKES